MLSFLLAWPYSTGEPQPNLQGTSNMAFQLAQVYRVWKGFIHCLDRMIFSYMVEWIHIFQPARQANRVLFILSNRWEEIGSNRAPVDVVSHSAIARQQPPTPDVWHGQAKRESEQGASWFRAFINTSTSSPSAEALMETLDKEVSGFVRRVTISQDLKQVTMGHTRVSPNSFWEKWSPDSQSLWEGLSCQTN